MLIGIGSLFSILLLCIIMDIAYYMAMTLIASNVFLILCLGILNVVSIFSIEGLCVATLAPAVMTISGSTFQPLLTILSISGLYFSILRVIVSSGNLSLQYVNSMNCIVKLSLGSIGTLVLWAPGCWHYERTLYSRRLLKGPEFLSTVSSIGGGDGYGSPLRHKRYGLNMALQ